MKKNVGIWIDHSKAIIVFINGEEHEIKEIASETKHHPHSQVVADDIRQSVETEYLNRFYEEVIATIKDAKSILIFGPGEAKGELRKRLENDNFGERIVGIESADKMTEPQIVSQVRSCFSVALDN